MKWLWRFLRIRGDVSALRRGRYPQRIVRRKAHRALGRVMRRSRWLR